MNRPTARPERILVRGVNWLGDAIMTTPALLRLREAFPEAHLSVLTPAKLADLYVHHPAVDAVLLFARQDSLWSLGRQLREGQFDLGLVLPNSPRSALELWLGRVPRRVGYAARWRRWWLTQALPPRPGSLAMRKRPAAEVRRLAALPVAPPRAGPGPRVHHVFHYLDLAGAVGARPEPLPPAIAVTEREVAAAAARFGLAPGPAPWLALNAGAEYGPAKRWPPERFAHAATEIASRTPARWAILGGPGDVPTAAQVERQIGAPGSSAAPPVLNLAGRTSLRDLAAVLRSCGLLLTNDTGPMHLGAAVGTPVVALFGSTSPELTGPGLPGDPRHRLLCGPAPCAPCFRRECPIDCQCLAALAVPQVVEACLETLAGTNRSR